MEETIIKLARELEEKCFGKYRAFVHDNKDPQKRARLQLRVPSLLGDQVTDWALPCLPFGGLKDQGFFAVPEKETQVWVEFEEGDICRPIWTGTFWQQQEDVPKEAVRDEPTTRLFKTMAGHVLQFDDEKDKERIRLQHPKKAEMTIDEKGTLTLTDAKGSQLTLDADAKKVIVRDANGNTLTMSSSGTRVEDKNGNKIEMAASGITVKGKQVVVDGEQVLLGGQGGEPVILGMSFLNLFAAHVHPTPAGGPSGPPVPQGELCSLSTKVMTT